MKLKEVARAHRGCRASKKKILKCDLKEEVWNIFY
jgi:hypothetical protein